MCIFDIVSVLNGGPLAVTPALSKGEGEVQKRNLLFLAANSSAAPSAPETCPALSGPAEALRFPRGQVNSERWTKLFGQPAGRKGKKKIILSASPLSGKSGGIVEEDVRDIR